MLGHFLKWAGEPKLRDFTLVTARTFIAHLQGRKTRYDNHPVSREVEGGLSPHSVHGYVRSLRVFSAWLADEGFTTGDVLEKLKRPKLPDTMIEVLTDQEVNKILADINPNCFLGGRLYTMILLMLDTGVRASELLGMKVEDVDLNNGRVKVLGKGKKERFVPFGGTTKKALLRYMNLYMPQGSNLVFTSLEGKPLTYTALSHVITRLGKRVGIPRLHCHLLRHSFAVRYLMTGGDLMSLRLILGHNDISTTQLYLKLSQSHITTQHHAHSPVDRLKTS
jgi:site-specific recombinase XerD